MDSFGWWHDDRNAILGLITEYFTNIFSHPYEEDIQMVLANVE